MNKIQIGISACLLGQRVRFDGGHKKDSYITETLNQYFDYLPFCPEVAIGLGVPRPSMKLIRSAQGPRAIVTQTGEDKTQGLETYAQSVHEKTWNLISGYIFKKKSPSCGMERIPVNADLENPSHISDRGIFAKALMKLNPDLPYEEEGRLADANLRENFIKRVFIYHEYQEKLLNPSLTTKQKINNLIKFHTRHKLLLILHHDGNQKALGHLVAHIHPENLNATLESYLSLLMKTLRRRPARRHHVQVLTRIMGYLNDQLHPIAKADIAAMILEYEKGYIPLITPIRTIRHYLTQIDQAYIQKQSYLNPYPEALGLMNQI